MPNNYTTETTLTMIPKALVSSFEEMMLEAFGASFETGDTTVPSWYIYAFEGFGDDPHEDVLESICTRMDTDSLPTAIRTMAAESFPEGSNKPEWLKTILAAGDDEIEAFSDFCMHRSINAYSILQGLLTKGAHGVPVPKAIEVEGSYWCEKARPGEFGGFSCYITAENVRFGSSRDFLAQAKNRETADDLKRDLEVIQAAARAVVDSWEKGDLAGAVCELSGLLPEIDA